MAALLNADDGSVAACYEYSPFGEPLRCEGSYAKLNPFRFSTKYHDDETTLVYFGRRYYHPWKGRFLGRDPREEAGGLNPYGFVLNNPVNAWDYLGMTGFLACGWAQGYSNWASQGMGPSAYVTSPSYGVSAGGFISPATGQTVSTPGPYWVGASPLSAGASASSPTTYSTPYIVSEPALTSGANAGPAYTNQTNARLNTFPYAQQQVSSCGPGAARNALALLLNRQGVPAEATIAQTMATAADAYVKTLNSGNSFDITRFLTTPSPGVLAGIGGNTATAAFDAVFNPYGFHVTRPLLGSRDATAATLQSGNVFIIATQVSDLFGSGTGTQGHFITVQFNPQQNNFTVYDSGTITNGVGTVSQATLDEIIARTLPSSSGATNNVYVITPD